jgi:hypothetical protein
MDGTTVKEFWLLWLCSFQLQALGLNLFPLTNPLKLAQQKAIPSSLRGIAAPSRIESRVITEEAFPLPI